MKRTLFAAFIILFSFSACGDDAREDNIEPETAVQVQDSLTTIKGEFIYLADAAVLKGKDFIYGVELDSISMKLADSVAPLKKDNFDMVPVTVRAKIINNPGEGWEEIAQIREILEVSQSKADSVKAPAMNTNEEQD